MPTKPSSDDPNRLPAGPHTHDAQASLGDLVDAHQHMLWRYLRLLGADADEADDLMQEAFLAVDRALRRGEQLRAPDAFLRGIARNLLLAARRKHRRLPIAVQWLDAVDDFVASQPQALDDERLERLRHCLNQLSGRTREAVERHHLDGTSLDETAQHLGVGLEGLRSLLTRARRSLRECIERMQGAPT